MKNKLRVGVIGGGIAGLAAAFRLTQQGHNVILWERSEWLGGQAAAFPVAGSALEYFYHHLFMSDTEIIQLVEDLGIQDKLIWLSSKVGFFADGKIYPLEGAIDLLKLDFIPFHDRLRIGFTTLYLQNKKDWRDFERVTAADWLRRAVGERAFNRVFGAQLRAKFGPRYDQVAMVWFWNKMFLRTQSRKSPLSEEQLGYFEGSFNTLIDRLEEAIGEQGGVINAGAGINQVQQADSGKWLVHTDEADPVECDAVVATVPSPILFRLVPDLPDWYREKLSGAIYQGATVMILQTTQRLSDVYWLNIGDPELPFTGIIEHTNFIGPENYQGSHFIYLSKYVDQDHPYFSYSDEELLDEYIPYLQKVNPEFSRDWVEQFWVFKERAAQPIITLNYSENVPEHRTPLQGLYLANTAQIYPEDRGTNYSVRLGNKVAELVKNDLEIERITPADRD